MHCNVPYQRSKSEYKSEYESDDTERPKSEYYLNTRLMILRAPTDTEKGIVNLEIEDLSKDIQDLKKGKGHTLPYHHHQNFHPGRHKSPNVRPA